MDIIQEWEYQGRFREVRSAWAGRILTFMAGAEAEIAIFGDCSGGDGDDRYQIDQMLSEIDLRARTHDGLERRFRSWAETLCKRHVERIRELATALIERETLSDDEIRAVIACPKRPHDPQVMAMFEV